MDHKLLEILAKDVEDLLYHSSSFDKIIPRDNQQAKLINATFKEGLEKIRNNLLDHTSPDESENPLSTRENEILHHVANGFTNNEIASALSLSPKTIEYHLRSIFEKTESSTRTEAAKIALKKGWIS